MPYEVNREMDMQYYAIIGKATVIIELSEQLKTTPSNAGMLQAHSMALDTIIDSLRRRIEEETR